MYMKTTRSQLYKVLNVLFLHKKCLVAHILFMSALDNDLKIVLIPKSLSNYSDIFLCSCLLHSQVQITPYLNTVLPVRLHTGFIE